MCALEAEFQAMQAGLAPSICGMKMAGTAKISRSRITRRQELMLALAPRARDTLKFASRG
jgi:hypothetical protein